MIIEIEKLCAGNFINYYNSDFSYNEQRTLDSNIRAIGFTHTNDTNMDEIEIYLEMYDEKALNLYAKYKYVFKNIIIAYDTKIYINCDNEYYRVTPSNVSFIDCLLYVNSTLYNKNFKTIRTQNPSCIIRETVF